MAVRLGAECVVGSEVFGQCVVGHCREAASVRAPAGKSENVSSDAKRARASVGPERLDAVEMACPPVESPRWCRVVTLTPC